MSEWKEGAPSGGEGESGTEVSPGSQHPHAASANAPGMFILVLCTAMSVLALNMMLPSLVNIAREFGVGYGVASIAVAGYLGVTAVLQVVVGPLSDRYGRRPVMLVSLAIFTVASVGCLFATSITAFLGFRLMQGTMTAGYTLSMAIVRDMLPEREAASRIGYIGMAMGIGPMLGPAIGGGLDDLFGWRATFVFYAILGALTLILCVVNLGETNWQRSTSFRQQLRSYPELFQSRRFWGYALCVAFSVAAFYTFLAGMPLVATSMLSMTAGQLGIGIGSITAGYICGGFLAGRLSRRYPLTTPVIAGRLIGTTGLCAGLALVSLGWVNVWTLFGATLFVGLGNGLTTPGASTGAMSVRPNLAGSAAGLTGALVVGCGAIFTSLAGWLVPPRDGAMHLLGLMLLCTLLGLVAALLVRRIERRRLAVT